MSGETMISNRPYLIRAIYDWIVDNGWTPHMQIDAGYPGTQVPRQFVQEGMIVLNVHPDAIMASDFNNQMFSFKARFQGVEHQLWFAPEAVLAVFARENGQGMPFPAEPYPEEAGDAEQQALDDAKKPTLTSVKGNVKKDKSESGAESKSKKAKKKPTLTVVK
ncbi:ClpXP protease specificity-enhancing factor [Thiomicrorhabdus sediminis]|nr:ClpXP protease specificity-enhancing factor [Thiomicrorhabdus sediminis]